MAKDFRNLLAWREAIQLAQFVDFATRSMPQDEQELLAAEMREFATAVPRYIARGFAMKTRADFLGCMRKANRAIIELDTRIMIAQGLEFIDACAADALLSTSNLVGERLQKILHSIERRVRRF